MERYNTRNCKEEFLDGVIAGELKFPENGKSPSGDGKSPSEEKRPERGWKSYALCSALHFLGISPPVYFLGEQLAGPDVPYRSAFIPINGGMAAVMLCYGVFHAFYYALSSQMGKSTQND